MGRCGCPSPETCGCVFDSTGDIVATGSGAADNPMRLQLADGLLPVKVCTLDSRPFAPETGQPIFESDTDRFLFWNGLRWVHVAPVTAEEVNTGFGAHACPAGATTTLLATTLTTPYDAGIKYRAYVSAFVEVSGGIGGEAWELLLLQGVTVVGETPVQIGANGFGMGTLAPLEMLAASGEDMSVTVQMQSVSASAAITTVADARRSGIRAHFFPA